MSNHRPSRGGRKSPARLALSARMRRKPSPRCHLALRGPPSPTGSTRTRERSTGSRIRRASLSPGLSEGAHFRDGSREKGCQLPLQPGGESRNAHTILGRTSASETLDQPPCFGSGCDPSPPPVVGVLRSPDELQLKQAIEHLADCRSRHVQGTGQCRWGVRLVLDQPPQHQNLRERDRSQASQRGSRL